MRIMYFNGVPVHIYIDQYLSPAERRKRDEAEGIIDVEYEDLTETKDE